MDFLLKAITVVILTFGGLFAIDYFAGPIDLNVSSVTTQKDNLFNVSDTAKVFAQPDTATIQVGVTKEAKSVAQVQEGLNTANNAIISTLTDLGIKEDSIKTVNFSINPKYRYDQDSGEQSINGYQANSRLEVRTTDFEQINQIIDTATKAGANEVGQVNFIVDNRDEYIKKARQEAIASAKEKAKEISSEAGLKLGRLVDIQVSENNFSEPVYFDQARMESVSGLGGGGANVQPGQDQITVSVQLSYIIE